MQRRVTSSHTVGAPAGPVARVLFECPEVALGPRPQGPGHRHRTALGLTASGAHVGADVDITLTPLPAGSDGTVRSWAIAVDPATHERALPSLRGMLEVIASGDDACELRVEGDCHVPLGVVGAAGHAVAGARVAQRSIDALVQGMASRIGAELARQAVTSTPRFDYAPDLRD